MRDVFDVQEDIARCIAHALSVSLSPHEGESTSPDYYSMGTDADLKPGYTSYNREPFPVSADINGDGVIGILGSSSEWGSLFTKFQCQPTVAN